MFLLAVDCSSVFVATIILTIEPVLGTFIILDSDKRIMDVQNLILRRILSLLMEQARVLTKHLSGSSKQYMYTD